MHFLSLIPLAFRLNVCSRRLYFEESFHYTRYYSTVEQYTACCGMFLVCWSYCRRTRWGFRWVIYFQKQQDSSLSESNWKSFKNELLNHLHGTNACCFAFIKETWKRNSSFDTVLLSILRIIDNRYFAFLFFTFSLWERPFQRFCKFEKEGLHLTLDRQLLIKCSMKAKLLLIFLFWKQYKFVISPGNE